MNNPYVERELKKVLASAEYPKNMALAAAWVIAHYKGVNIKIFDVSQTSSLCDFNIIASAENQNQAKSMVHEIKSQLQELGSARVNSVEGLTSGEWMLLDMLDIIVHVFQETSREVFSLESLWPDSPQVEIPHEFYFGAGEDVNSKEDPTDNYF